MWLGITPNVITDELGSNLSNFLFSRFKLYETDSRPMHCKSGTCKRTTMNIERNTPSQDINEIFEASVFCLRYILDVV